MLEIEITRAKRGEESKTQGIILPLGVGEDDARKFTEDFYLELVKELEAGKILIVKLLSKPKDGTQKELAQHIWQGEEQ